MKDKKGKNERKDFSSIKTNIIKAGAIPKLTRSARESICLPKFDVAFRIRAKKPSKKSKKADKKTNNAAI